jgi:competence protein ComEC
LTPMCSITSRAMWFLLLLLLPAIAGAQPRTLDIYWIDVEGGAATLIVSPSGESLLYDAGWEVDGRDGKRIAAVVQQAGLKKIDYFVLSHFHADHAGGLEVLSKLVPIGRCFDRGDFIEPANQKWRDIYLAACGTKRTIVKVGDRIPLKGIQVDVVASNGKLVAKPLAGGGPNPLCPTAENKPPEGPENQFMVGALFTYGRFKFLDLGDLDWQRKWSWRARSIGLDRSPSGRPAATARSTAPALPGFSMRSSHKSSSSTTDHGKDWAAVRRARPSR